MLDQYYIRCTTEDAGDFVLWWRPDGLGYTVDLSRAGKYSLEEARHRTSRDTPIPCAVADRAAVSCVPVTEALCGVIRG